MADTPATFPPPHLSPRSCPTFGSGENAPIRRDYESDNEEPDEAELAYITRVAPPRNRTRRHQATPSTSGLLQDFDPATGSESPVTSGRAGPAHPERLQEYALEAEEGSRAVPSWIRPVVSRMGGFRVFIKRNEGSH
ncbi:hypothetical protein P7C70_g33, partial [Phenoliferia sp. Uapishka_3]